MGRPPAGDAPPLILSLALDAASFARLDALRREHFPPALNRIPAHVTLFHHLPGEAEGEVAERLSALCRGRAPSPVRVSAVMPLGRGAAFRLEAPEVAALRAELAGAWAAWLTPQDLQPWRPHVTVQNKVAPEAARDTEARLREGFEPWEARAEGLLLWRYRNGPWEAAGAFPFRA
jgi:2'-5' RNA ligase